MSRPGDGHFRRKIAVLGGGIGALSAVFDMTSDEHWKERFEITVYQVGWRLGGKGASGRFDSKEASFIEEHGLHIWPGFYHSSFDLMTKCLAELRRGGTSLTFDDLFEPLSHVFMSEEIDGKHVPWRLHFPQNRKVPGEGDPEDEETLIRALIRTMTRAVASDLRPRRSSKRRRDRAGASERTGTLAERLAAALSPLSGALGEILGGGLAEAAGRRVEAFLQTLRELRNEEAPDHAVRRTALLLELGGTILRGLLADDVLRRGFRHLDEEEWSAWLRRHGADDDVLGSAVVRACYDFAFAYADGRSDRRGMAAGAGTRMLLRMLLTYRGAFFYKMKASMGEVVFTPLYLVLKQRGVTFKFFHRVTAVRPDSSSTDIDEIEVVRQADVAGGPDAYQPLVPGFGSLPAWPSTPRLEQLSPRSDLEKVDLESFWSKWQGIARTTLRRGVDFDTVVLGISIGAFPWICADLIRANVDWRNMVRHVRTVPTQAMQLWLEPDQVALGARQAGSVVTAFTKPYDTWADMSHLLKVERWTGRTVRTVAYFCGVLEETESLPDLDDHDFPKREKARARANAEHWRKSSLPRLWPRFKTSDIRGLYVRANVNPSDRYVLTLPGSTKYRMAPGKSGFSNLYLAGDWVANDLNGGCVEGAVLAGREAASALLRNLKSRPRMLRRGRSANRGISPLAAERSALPWRLAYGVGQLDAVMLTVAVKTALVQSQLPAALQTVPQDVTTRGTHPVGLMFNWHRNVRPSFSPFSGLSYPEFGILIPFIGHADHRPDEVPMAYIADLFVGHLLAKAFGIPYGYNKRMASFDYRDKTFRVEASGTLVADATFARRGLPRTIDRLDQMATARTMIEQPMVNVDPAGFLHYSYLEMHLDEAEFQPMEGRVSLNDDRGHGIDRPISSIETSPLGAFAIRTHWTLTQPGQSPFLGLRIRGG